MTYCRIRCIIMIKKSVSSEIFMVFDEIYWFYQRISSQERENTAKRFSCLAPITSSRDESQMQLSRTSNNFMRRSNSVSTADQRCKPLKKKIEIYSLNSRCLCDFWVKNATVWRKKHDHITVPGKSNFYILEIIEKLNLLKQVMLVRNLNSGSDWWRVLWPDWEGYWMAYRVM